MHARSAGWARVVFLALAAAGPGFSPALGAPREPRIVTAPARAGASGIPGQRLERYADALGLDKDQREAARTLHEAYSARMKALSVDLDATMKDLAPRLQGEDGLAPLNAAMDEHRARSTQATDEFLKDLKAILTPAQAETTWPRLERLRRRDSLLGVGIVGGSNVDLISLIAGMKLSPELGATLRPTLDAYELDLDRALRPLEDLRGNGRLEIRIDSRDVPGEDPLKQRREESLKVRAVNQRYARTLAAALPEADAARLSELFRERSYREVYRPTGTGSRLGAALKLEDLTPEQQKQLADLNAKYEAELKAANTAIADATEKAEQDGKAVALPMGLPGPGGGSEEVVAARKARRELDLRTGERLGSILTPQQVAALPRPRSGGTTIMGGPVGGGGGGAILIGGADGGGLGIHDDAVIATEDSEDTDPETGLTVQTRSVFVVAPSPGLLPPNAPPSPPTPSEPPATPPK